MKKDVFIDSKSAVGSADFESSGPWTIFGGRGQGELEVCVIPRITRLASYSQTLKHTYPIESVHSAIRVVKMFRFSRHFDKFPAISISQRPYTRNGLQLPFAIVELYYVFHLPFCLMSCTIRILLINWRFRNEIITWNPYATVFPV